MPNTNPWWKESIVYQIYPKSFYDSNDDGIGDLKGIIEKLDYLKDLGIDCLWLCPIYKTPNDDNGYDISDYYSINPELGTMEDFDNLLKLAHEKGIKIILDIAINHTSDEHPWFIKSSSSKNNPKRDFYIWKDPKNGKEPNNWGSFFSQSAWEYHDNTGQYYLHIFSKKQPDLNWQNKVLRKEVYNVLKWWLDKGIDGFRLDVINAITKEENYKDKQSQDKNYVLIPEEYYNQPGVHEILKEMRTLVFDNYDMVSIGETPCITTKHANEYSEKERRELDMVFSFELRDIYYGLNGKWDRVSWTKSKFKEIVTRWQTELYNKGWQGLFLANHDTPRTVSAFGNDSLYWVQSSTMLATLLFTLQGTVFIFQGDEIGMTNVKFESIDDYKDIDSHFFYNFSVKNNILSQTQALQAIWDVGRDNCRTPVQWDDTKNAGFSTSNPWIKVNPNFTKINIVSQQKDKNSILSFYKKIINFRKKNTLLTYGEFIPLDLKPDEIFAYKRILDNKQALIVLNFSEYKTDIPKALAKDLQYNKIAVSNYKENHEKYLSPFEARIYI